MTSYSFLIIYLSDAIHFFLYNDFNMSTIRVDLKRSSLSFDMYIFVKSLVTANGGIVILFMFPP